ncbi:MAG: hypothetical protein ACOH5I_09175 [Oligoflexus sp.]
MRILSFSLILAFLFSCAESGFQSTNATGLAPQAQSENVEAEPVVETEQPEIETTEKNGCLLAVDGEEQALVSISQGNIDLSQVSPDSILFLKVQGLANIDLSAADITQIKGICIEAAGNSRIQLDLNATVSAMHYYARGSASTTFDFKQTGSLQKLITDVSGSSKLTLLGETLDCEQIEIPLGGDAIVECNGVVK